MPALLMPVARQQFLDNNGKPLNGGTVTFYEAGTTSLLPVYSDASQMVALPNPLTLDSSGRASVFFVPGRAYKVVVKNAVGAIIWTQDDVSSVASSVTGTDVIGVAGETLAPRQVVVLGDASTGALAGRFILSDVDILARSSSSLVMGVVTTAAASAGDPVSVRLSGVVGGYSGLTAGMTYKITTPPGAMSFIFDNRPVGTAISSTELLVSPGPQIAPPNPLLFGGGDSVVFANTGYPSLTSPYPTGNQVTASTYLHRLRTAELSGRRLECFLRNVGGGTTFIQCVNVSNGHVLQSHSSTNASGEYMVTGTVVVGPSSTTVTTIAIQTRVSSGTGGAWGIRLVKPA